MNNLVDNIKNNFFKTFIEWANGQYDLITHSELEHILDLQYGILDAQPINSVIKIGNQSVHRLFLPTNEKIINYEINLDYVVGKPMPIVGDFDIYISLIDGELSETLTDQKLKLNLVYIIPAGQYFSFETPTFAKYYMTIRQRETKKVNPNPTEIKIINFENTDQR